MQSITHRVTRHGLAFTAALALAAAPTLGADITWTGLAGDGDWGKATNWSGTNTPPLAADVAIFKAPNNGQLTVDINGGRTISSLVFSRNSEGGVDGYEIIGGENETLTIDRGSGGNIVSYIERTVTISADVDIIGAGSSNFVGSPSGLLTFTGTVNATKNITFSTNSHIAVSSTGSFGTSNTISINRNGSMTLDGTFDSTSINGVILNGGNPSQNNTAALILGDNASFTAVKISAQSTGTMGASSRIQRTGNTGVLNIDADMEFRTSTPSDVDSDRTVVLKFDGTGGDLTFDASKDWYTNTLQGTSTIADVEIGSGRTVSVLGSFVADADDNTHSSSLNLYGGGKLVVGDSLADTYAWVGGGITVTGATLVFNSNMTSTGAAIDVNDDGILGGTGTINRNVNVAAGGKLAPGQSPGTLNITGVVDLASGFTLDWEYGEFLKDLVNITGTLDLTDANTSASTVNLIDAGGTLQSGDILFATTGGITGVLSGTVLDWTINGGEGFSAVVDGNNVILVIPEPATVLLALAGGLLILPYRGRGRGRRNPA